jgi:chromosome segregation ATPase
VLTKEATMVSRVHTATGKKKSAPRSTKGSSTPRTSFEQWENVNDNVHSSQQYGDDRRSKSSMRYQSAVRTRAKGDNLPLQQQSKQTSSQRPRPISTGRLRHPVQGYNEDDPDAVTRQIMDLREQREAGLLSKSSSSRNMQRGPATNYRRKDSPMAGYHGGGNSSLPEGQNYSSSRSNLSHEDMHANERLENAEGKISGLLQELEELQFFDELEAEDPPATTPRIGKTPRTPSAAPKTSYPNPSPRTSGNGIPTSIRASPSPAKARLPPAPPTTSETYIALSPRKIAKMDRLTLELETQTLIRKVQVLDGERKSMESMIQMYETSLQSQDKDKARTQRLEEELRKVSYELKKQLLSIQIGKEKLVQEYEDKLNANMKKLHKTQGECDSYKMDVEVAKSDADKWLLDLEQLRTRTKEEKLMSEDAEAREAVLELQLTEAQNFNTQLQKKMEKYRNESSSLKKELQDMENKKDEAYEARIAALQKELVLSKERHTNVELELVYHEETLQDKLGEMKAAQAKETEQAVLIKELQSQLESVETTYKKKFEELKKSNYNASTRKMQDLVAERANFQKQYESRLQTLQQQLKHQSDRHHAEIEETRKLNEENLNEMKDTIRHEIYIEERDAKMQLENELSILKRNNEDAINDLQQRLKQAENKERQTNAEWKRQEEIRQQELDHMHDRLQSYVSDLTEREERIRQLTQDIESIDKRNGENESCAQDRHQTELRKRDDLAEDTRMKYKELELELREEIVKKETTFAEIEQRMNAETVEALKKLDVAYSVFKENETIKERIEEVQNAFDSVQQGLGSERSRHETIESELRAETVKIQGKLRASESSLKQKRDHIEDLEGELKDAVSYSRAEDRRLAEIQHLKNDLAETSELLETERLEVKEKDAIIDRLRREMKAVQKKANEMSMLEDVVKEMKKRAAAIDEDMSEQSAELEKLRIEHEVATTKLVEADQRHSIVKGGIEAELQSSEKFYQDTVERYTKTVQELESKLAAEATTKTELECAVNDLKWSLARVKEVKSIQTDELTNLRRDYEELSGVVEENMDFSARKDELDLKLARKERQLRDTVEESSKTILELQGTVENETKSKLSLENSLARLQVSLDKTQEERNKLVSELSLLRLEKEEAASKLMETERSHLQSKGGIDAEIGRKDRQLREAIQRYTCNIAELESKLEEETQLKRESEDKLESVRAELETKQKTTEELIQRQTKTEKSLEAQIDRDAVEKQELKVRLDKVTSDLERKKKELKDTIDEFTIQFTELEGVKSQHSEYKVMSQSTRYELERKQKEMSQIQIKIPDLLSELEKSKRERDSHKSRAEKLESELAKKKAQLKEVISRSTETIADLEADLDEQSTDSANTQEMIEIVRSEVSRKDERIKELEKNIADLQSKLEKLSSDSDSAKQSFVDIARELDDKESQMYTFEMEKIELETRLTAQSRSKDDMRNKISDLTSKLERKEREVREVTDRYKVYVGELESKFDQDGTSKFRLQSEVDKLKIDLLSAADASSDAMDLRNKITDLTSKLERKEREVREVTDRYKLYVGELESKLDDESTLKFRLQSEVDKLKIDLMSAADVSTDAMDLRNKISDLTSKLERKEREVREYKIHVGELESKFDQESSALQSEVDKLQSEVDKLKLYLTSAKDVSTDATELRERVSSLENSVENYRGKARDAESRAKDKIMVLTEKLASATKSKDEIDGVLKKVNGEKAEVIAALEGVIHEVQNREDEIESLSDLLHKRDEELEHAKVIATKALASAKDIQKRYKGKEKELNSGLFEKMDALHDDIDKLKSKNDTLQHKISMLERDLRERNMECKRLKDQLRQIDGNALRNSESFKSNDDETHSTYATSRSHTSNQGSNFGSSHGSKMGRSVNIDPDSFHRRSRLDPDAFSPAHSPESLSNGFSEEEYPAFEVQRSTSNDGMSTSTPELMGQAANNWVSDYETEDRSGIESVHSGGGSTHSKQSMERDALRKYVRKRYMNRK